MPQLSRRELTAAVAATAATAAIVVDEPVAAPSYSNACDARVETFLRDEI